MPEDLKPVEGQVEGEAPEGKEELDVQTPELSPAEEKAAGLGWVPKEDWVAAGKDPDDWKPAKLFLEHGDMIGQIRAKSRELDDTRQALRFMHEKNKTVFENGYKTAISELRQQKRQALADGDLVLADQIDEKIEVTKDELDAVRKTPPPQPKQVDPEHETWLQQNMWYTDPVMQRYADSLAIEYIRVNKGTVTPNQVRDYLSKEVPKEFPHKFASQPKKVTGAPSPDGEGRTNNQRPQSNGLPAKLAKAKSEMTDEQKNIMKTLVKSTGMTEAKYLEMYLA